MDGRHWSVLLVDGLDLTVGQPLVAHQVHPDPSSRRGVVQEEVDGVADIGVRDVLGYFPGDDLLIGSSLLQLLDVLGLYEHFACVHDFSS